MRVVEPLIVDIFVIRPQNPVEAIIGIRLRGKTHFYRVAFLALVVDDARRKVVVVVEREVVVIRVVWIVRVVKLPI